uniref:Saposin A-type domain-containing protein n=1 Tax=Chromera velia CCMP2878 TaxID=1169474 RepID=A0A0G4FDT0_9ALVE|mmetsp:Transcript_49177/g.96956  ORF Transcript_49177/g.96956 Transcript_49177/m.96956 type:complete len:262 (+) Transcript_49177:165-950(+)|eukprot:Cvel_16506.t1-p1 / transcript=Cvel_16506.t1 / gene=Cvel_16506 / organism=Chromera_velia_CCMP2878 / gene_product=GILT-like protein F37H8.5, putative / transcript_product=GILT-like protein F37H8.5, putative / location=Cvel_scaffold1273:18672-23239(-) / protein_length=261 / sequence_SO=supercontig / SO=protein_coding / is_pseudo=false
MRLLFAFGAFCGLNLAGAQLFEAETNKKLEIALYYEALCPFCEQFITQQLLPATQDAEIKDKFTIEMVPYGNVHGGQCQHGPTECYLNKVEGCGIKYIEGASKNNALALPFIDCIEKNTGGDGTKWKDECVGLEFGVEDAEVIAKCVEEEGDAIFEEMGKKTPTDHKFVPWVTVNGKQSDAARADLKKFILSGGKEAEGFQGLPLLLSRRPKEDSENVCLNSFENDDDQDEEEEEDDDEFGDDEDETDLEDAEDIESVELR